MSNRLFRVLVTAFIALAWLAGCAPPVPATPAAVESPSGQLVVFAAASLTEAFEEMAAKFEAANPSAELVFNFGGSQQLAQQLAQGAPADVFASANKRQMQVVIEAGRVMSDTAQVFAGNRLVVIVPDDNPAGLAELLNLAKPGVKLVLAAPEVPVGGYTLEFLRRASDAPGFTAVYSPTVLANVVSYEENVRAVLSKVTLGEADAGIVYSSDAPPDAAVGRIDIPDELNVLAAYPIAPVADAGQADLARRFIEYVLSAEGQAILSAHGFVAP